MDINELINDENIDTVVQAIYETNNPVVFVRCTNMINIKELDLKIAAHASTEEKLFYLGVIAAYLYKYANYDKAKIKEFCKNYTERINWHLGNHSIYTFEDNEIQNLIINLKKEYSDPIMYKIMFFAEISAYINIDKLYTYTLAKLNNSEDF